MDVKVEILMRLSAKSIAKFNFVSNHWSSTVRGREFMDLYMERSSTRPRLLFRVYRSCYTKNFFLSCSQKDPSCDNQWVNFDKGRFYHYSPPVRGLISCQEGIEVFVGNPTTGQFVKLPKPATRRLEILSFFGYDPVDDLYKVMCMTVKNVYQKRGSQVVSEQHQVFTLGAGEPWRMIECKCPHLPPVQTTGVCLNGVVYYYAWIKFDGSLITFDVRSELFGVIELPEDVRLLKGFCNVVNYCGKIGLTNDSHDGTLDLRVLEDATKQVWSKVSVVVPSWRTLVGRSNKFCFRGALSTGELIFGPDYTIRTLHLISYDLKENNAKKIVIEGIGNCLGCDVFFDHLESPLFLSM